MIVTMACSVCVVLAALSQAPAAAAPEFDFAGARVQLDQVLAADEFRGIHGPTAFDRFKQQLLDAFVRLLSRLVGSSAVPVITHAIVYLLIAAAVAAIAIWMYRAIRRDASAKAFALSIDLTPARSWEAWLVDARSAAAQGDWRSAVRLAYWCGVAFLEARGEWRADPSRTPREYLRLLPAASPHASPLGGLTRLLERVWYGTSPADATRFDEALTHLEQLGCHSR